jgi:hypothetical protein
MNPIRTELETRLKAFADSASPALKVAFEGVLFTKPSAPFLECFLFPAHTKNVTTAGTRKRECGVFQVNVWTPSGKGTREAEDIAQGIVDAFPIVPKTGLVSVEQTPEKGRAMPDVPGWLIIPVTISYRYES